MTKRNIITAYMNSRHEVIRKIRSVHPNPAADRAHGYLADLYFRNPNKPREFAVYAEVYEEDTTIQHATLKFIPGANDGNGRVISDYKRSARDHENRYAITPLLEAAAKSEES